MISKIRSVAIVLAGKAVIITQSGCVFVAPGTQQAIRVRHFFICGLTRPAIFVHPSIYQPTNAHIISHKTI